MAIFSGGTLGSWNIKHNIGHHQRGLMSKFCRKEKEEDICARDRLNRPEELS